MVKYGFNKALFLGGGYVRGGWLISHFVVLEQDVLGGICLNFHSRNFGDFDRCS